MSGQRRYEVVLDGIEVSDEEHQQLEKSIQGVVRDFLEGREVSLSRERADASGSGRLEIVDEPEALRKRLGGLKFDPDSTVGIWAGPQIDFE